MAAKKRTAKKAAKAPAKKRAGRKAKAKKAHPAYKAKISGEGGTFGCYTKRVGKRGGGTRAAAYCRNTKND